VVNHWMKQKRRKRRKNKKKPKEHIKELVEYGRDKHSPALFCCLYLVYPGFTYCMSCAIVTII
jgi:hypothetical protein